MHFFSQPYLDVSDGKHWRDATKRQIQAMINYEDGVKIQLQRKFSMSPEQWAYVYYWVEQMGIEILAQIFSGDGVLKRGN